ncbi:hypothetical protein [Endozoicomonas sp. SCSIO W0465]|uniref:hypothetical protein n=1 Tax=Endozoicomonas sp. SCSIO W0465 TaxID=2918516 RepID=UPI002075805D|nr:hypothetical protein [Endozoicomonas sp. SCSIO W0465]USE38442.1 hypothetical protein MJO57_09885 [Endozoicomonas sp. SCSIO W0465]
MSCTEDGQAGTGNHSIGVSVAMFSLIVEGSLLTTFRVTNSASVLSVDALLSDLTLLPLFVETAAVSVMVDGSDIFLTDKPSCLQPPETALT